MPRFCQGTPGGRRLAERNRSLNSEAEANARSPGGLYERGIKQRLKREEAAKRRRREREAAELAACTFSPTIKTVIDKDGREAIKLVEGGDGHGPSRAVPTAGRGNRTPGQQRGERGDTSPERSGHRGSQKASTPEAVPAHKPSELSEPHRPVTPGGTPANLHGGFPVPLPQGERIDEVSGGVRAPAFRGGGQAAVGGQSCRIGGDGGGGAGEVTVSVSGAVVPSLPPTSPGQESLNSSRGASTVYSAIVSAFSARARARQERARTPTSASRTAGCASGGGGGGGGASGVVAPPSAGHHAGSAGAAADSEFARALPLGASESPNADADLTRTTPRGGWLGEAGARVREKAVVGNFGASVDAAPPEQLVGVDGGGIDDGGPSGVPKMDRSQMEHGETFVL